MAAKETQPQDQPDPAFEAAFRAETEQLLLHRLRLALGVGSALYLLFFILDLWVFPQHWLTFLGIRAFVAAMSLTTIAITYHTLGRRWLVPLSVAIMTVGTLGLSAMTWIEGGFASDYYFGNMLALFLVGLFFPWSVRTAIVYSGLVISGYAIPNTFFHPGTAQDGVLPVFFLLGTSALTCYATLAIDKSRRTEFALRNQLEAANAELQKLDEAKTRFFSNVSHELRTPLMLILGPLESMLRGTASDPAALLQAMNANAHRLLRQVNTILNFSRIEAGRQECHPVPGRVGSVLHDLVTAAVPYAKKRGIQLTGEGLEELPDSWFDHEQIETVAANLLSNAMKFTPDGGEVTVRAGTEGDKLWFEVADTGVGIPEKDLDKVFIRFHQVDGGKGGKIQGTGLGLALSRELVRLHKGEMSVSSTLGEGTCFRVELPLGRPEGAEEAPPAETAPRVERDDAGATQFADLVKPSLENAQGGQQAPEGAPLLMVVDDNPDMRNFVAQSLSRLYRVVTAEDGQDGLETARRTHPDLIVSDVMMPRLDGFGMVEALRKDKAFAATPIIMLTARTGSEAMVKGLSLGAVDYVNKPFKLVEIEARIAAQLRMRQVEKTLDERDSRLVAVGQMTGAIAHDLRGPLTAILGRIELVRMFAEASGGLENISEDLEAVERTVQRVAGMATELVEFVRGGNVALELEAHSLNRFAAQVVQDARPPLEDLGISLDFEENAEDLKVMLDSNRMARVVENLINNARDALAQDPERKDARIHVEIRRGEGSGQAILRVADNGPGIPEDIRDRIFQAFATSGKKNGTGLGLSIVRNLVTAHGGTIEIEDSPPEGGAAFRITLPVRRAEEDQGERGSLEAA